MTESGKPVFVPLDRVRTHRNTDKRGTFRWYNGYRLPEHLGGASAFGAGGGPFAGRFKKADRSVLEAHLPAS